MTYPIVRDAAIDQDGAAVATVDVPPDCPFMDGHFPGAPILPGVAQLWVVARSWEAATGKAVRLSAVRRMKFTARVVPGTVLDVRIEPVGPGGRVAFTLKDARVTYSTGELTLSPEAAT